MRLSPTTRRGLAIAATGLAWYFVVAIGVVVRHRGDPASDFMPSWAYWLFLPTFLLWVWGIAFAIPRRFRLWAFAYAGVTSAMSVAAIASLARGA